MILLTYSLTQSRQVDWRSDHSYSTLFFGDKLADRPSGIWFSRE